jgi:F-type H+-transporting ATPase subunit epsilon
MHLVVLTPEKAVYSGEVKSVKVPGVDGQFEVLNNHAPIVSALASGEVRLIKSDGSEERFVIEKGFIEVIYNKVSLLVTGYKPAA